MVFSGDGALLVTGTRHYTQSPTPTSKRDIAVWRMSTRAKLKEWTVPDQCPSQLILDREGSLLALMDDQEQTIGIWDSSRGARLKTVATSGYSFVFTADSRQLVLRDLNDAVVIWDLEANRIVGARMRPYFSLIYGRTKTNPSLGMAISADSKTIAFG